MKQYLKARALEGALGRSSAGNPQVVVAFIVSDGPREGERLQWYGSFSELSRARTIESLRHCGWEGDNLADLTGLGANEVEVVVDQEEFNGQTREKVQWVNRGGVAVKSRMTGQDLAAFAAEMRGFIVAQKFASVAPGATMPTTRVPVPKPPKTGLVRDETYEECDDSDIPF